jgi:hypothetical protein
MICLLEPEAPTDQPSTQPEPPEGARKLAAIATHHPFSRRFLALLVEIDINQLWIPHLQPPPLREANLRVCIQYILTMAQMSIGWDPPKVWVGKGLANNSDPVQLVG